MNETKLVERNTVAKNVSVTNSVLYACVSEAQKIYDFIIGKSDNELTKAFPKPNNLRDEQDQTIANLDDLQKTLITISQALGVDA